MNPKELRKGNLVQSNVNLRQNTVGEKLMYQVYEIKSFKAQLQRVYNGCITLYTTHLSYQEIEGIPLTEEWMRSFGFDEPPMQFPVWQIRIDEDNMFEIFGEDNVNGTGESCFGVRYNKMLNVEIEYVHQLQNLYFALTGQELIIKPKK